MHRAPLQSLCYVARNAAAVAIAPLLFLIVYSAFTPDQTLLQTDSASYVQFASERTGGYPLFLATLRPLASDPRTYVTAQLIAFATAAAGLGWSIFRSSNSVLISLVAQALLLANPEVNKQHFTVMTESLFLSVSVLMISATLRYLSQPSGAALIVAASAGAYAAVLRPTGLAYIPVLAVLVLLMRHQTSHALRHGVLAVMAVASIFLLEAAYYHAHHEGPRRSLLPVHSFGKAAMVSTADSQALVAHAPEESRAIYRALALDLEPMREFIAGAPNAPSRCRLVANYESFVQYEFFIRERYALQASLGDWRVTRVGWDRITHAPGNFVRHVADNYYCLWTIWAATNLEKEALQRYIAQRRPIPFEANVLANLATGPSPTAVVVVRPTLTLIAAMLMLAAVGVLVMAARGAPRSLWFSTAGICGLMAHGAFLLTATTGIATPRYTLALWAPISLGVFALLGCAAQVLLSVGECVKRRHQLLGS